MNEPKILSYDLREHIANTIIAEKGGHIGGDMSVMEILVELCMKQMNISPENKKLDNRDHSALSKGHSVGGYYAVLAKKGFFPMEEVISTFSQFGPELIGHPNNKFPGIEMNSDSLGHGLPVCVGMTMVRKMDRRDYRVYVVMGDGELAEDSVWEGTTAASHYCLDNLCAMVDRNRLQISGCTEDAMGHDDLYERFRSLGWHVIDVADENDIDQLDAVFEEAKTVKGKLTVLIVSTVKGCGPPVVENKAAWYYKVPTTQEYNEIIRDFGKRKEVLLHE